MHYSKFKCVNVHEHRKATDWDAKIKYLSDEMFPEAEKIILVMDYLNTHKPASLYKVFTPAETRRIIKRLEIHYMPKHGSWIDMEKIESQPYGLTTGSAGGLNEPLRGIFRYRL